jgi:hypothetical protein
MPSNELLKALKGVVSVIPPKYVEALLFLHEKWDATGLSWIVNGDLAMALRTVDIVPDCIEVVCSEKDSEGLYDSVKEYTPAPLIAKTVMLPQNVIYQGNQYPLYSRSNYFEFKANGIPIKVQGDLQFKVNDWEWGDTFEFQPEYVNVVGKKTAVTPLIVLYQLYSELGWTEKAQLIQQVLQRRAIRH